MKERVIVLIVPGLRERDLHDMPAFQQLAVDVAPLAPSFPSVSPVVQTCMLTGLLPQDHGIVASREYDRETQTIGNEPRAICFSSEPIWTTIRGFHNDLRGALIGLWPFVAPGGSPLPSWMEQQPYVTTPVAISAAITSSVQSGVQFVFARLPHLEEPGHQHGPDSAEFATARDGLNQDANDLEQKVARCADVNGDPPPLWIVVSEYAINPVRHVVRPNALLRAAGYRSVSLTQNGAVTAQQHSRNECVASVICDFQAAHIFLHRTCGEQWPAELAEVFRGVDGIAEVHDDSTKARRDLNHPAAGDLVLAAAPNATFSDGVAAEPRGTHGAPAETLQDRGVILASEPGVLLGSATMSDFDVAGLVLRQFGI